MRENYNPFITALSRDKPSKPTRILYDKGLLYGKVLDYGCGKGFDVEWLNQQGVYTLGYDKYNDEYNDIELLYNTYDVAICNYVLNTIPDLQTCYDIVDLLKHIADKIYIAVRSDIKAIRDSWEWDNRSQGCWTKNSFQRFYNDVVVDITIGDAEYIAKNNSFYLLVIKK